MSLLLLSPLLINRLKQKCPSVSGHVFSSADLAGVQEAAQIAPALHVVLWDYTPAEALPGRAGTSWRETWLVIAIVKNAARKDRSGAQIEAASPILDEALAAVEGWFPESGGALGSLQAVSGPRPAFTPTHAYFPLAFAVNVETGWIDVGDTSSLADFKTFAADYDIEPFEPSAEHYKWLQEPPDHGTSAPDMTDQLNLQEQKP